MERKVKLKLPDRLPRAIDAQHLDHLLSVPSITAGIVR